MSISMHKRLAFGAALAAVTLLPLAAQAQRVSPLRDAPAIRKRLELRDTRLEFGPGFTTTLNQDFYHTLFATVKLGFHFNDWLSLSGFANFPVANIDTGFKDRVVGSEHPTPTPNLPREPTMSEANAALSEITLALGGQLEFTPFTGKFSFAGALFAHYDFYIFLGGGALGVKPTNASGLRSCDTPAPAADLNDPNAQVNRDRRSCAVNGFKPGGNIGVGFHTYFNEWLALNVDLRDMITHLNPAGRDVNGDGVADSADLTWTSTWMVGASLVVYLPFRASISP
jgi:outer membrane beta-barrel protein